jgi:hypothetical protein
MIREEAQEGAWEGDMRDKQRSGTAATRPIAARMGSATAILAILSAATLLLPTSALAHALKASDTAHLRYISASGSLLNEVGRATGTVPGSMSAHMDLSTTFSGSFTIYTSAGQIRGHGLATPHGSGTYESFAGTVVATGGTGRYTHAHGTARLYGTFDRDNYALVMQTVGTLFY